MKKIALVTNWFGEKIKGGAEQQALNLAKHLSEQGQDITILTTCSRSFHDTWDENYFPSGRSTEAGLKTLRFEVDERNPSKFNSVVSTLLQKKEDQLYRFSSPLSPAQEKIYLEHNIYSKSLYSYLKHHKENYDIFIFMPYLFPLSILGSLIVKEKAFLQLCLHDECYAYLPSVRRSVYSAKGLLFNSRGEQITARKIFGSVIDSKSHLVYEGVETSFSHSMSQSKPLIDGKYLLYLGKKCREKNVDMLISAFNRFTKRHQTEWKLILAGPSKISSSLYSEHIIDLGYIESDAKENLLHHAQMIINLSENESFSRLIFEGWQCKKPVVIHKKCLATYTALVDSQFAGYSIEGLSDAYNFFTKLDQIPLSELQLKGELGFSYSTNVSNWERVADRYIEIFNQINSTQRVIQIIAYKLDRKSQIAIDHINNICLQKNLRLDIFTQDLDDISNSDIPCKNLVDIDPSKNIIWFDFHDSPFPTDVEINEDAKYSKISVLSDRNLIEQQTMAHSLKAKLDISVLEVNHFNQLNIIIEPIVSHFSDKLMKAMQFDGIIITVLCQKLSHEIEDFMQSTLKFIEKHLSPFAHKIVYVSEQDSSNMDKNIFHYFDQRPEDLSSIICMSDFCVFFQDFDSLVPQTLYYKVPFVQVNDRYNKNKHFSINNPEELANLLPNILSNPNNIEAWIKEATESWDIKINFDNNSKIVEKWVDNESLSRS